MLFVWSIGVYGFKISYLSGGIIVYVEFIIGVCSGNGGNNGFDGLVVVLVMVILMFLG